MRIRILRRPTRIADGVTPRRLFCGRVYDVHAQVAHIFLTEGWAEIINDGDAVAVVRPTPDIAKTQPLVLVVDDEPELRRLTEDLLTANGYRVSLARHGQEAFDRLRECCPDLIVLDLNMPVMDGWRFRTEQRHLVDKKLAAVPVLLMTGEDTAANARTLRAVGVINKPFDPDTLLAAVSAAIGSKGSAA